MKFLQKIFLIFVFLFSLTSCLKAPRHASQNSSPLADLSDQKSPYDANGFLLEGDEETKKIEKAKPTLAIFEPRPPTPTRFFSADLSMPIKFGTTNNLVKKVGEFYRSYGEVIFIQGTLTDSFGVPIDNAIIEIWQTNAAGKYHSLLEPDSEYIDPYFNMSGRTTTDNLGNYHFITIMPGASPGRAPHINMNVYHSKFGKLETEMYFQDHPYNKTDYQFLSYKPEEQKFLIAAVRSSDLSDKRSNKLCTFNIVMQGVHQFKRF